MPFKEPDPSDPSMLVGVSLPADPASDLDMAYAFAEEFARMGFDAQRLLGLFQLPFYAGAHRLWLVLGEETIRGVIAEAIAVWGVGAVRAAALPPAFDAATSKPGGRP